MGRWRGAAASAEAGSGLRRLVVLGFVLAALVGLDLGTRLWSEGQVEAAARREAPDASASADIDAFPFLPPLLAGGRVSHVDVVLRGVGAGDFEFDRLAFSLDGVKVSRRSLFREGEIDLIDIDRGTITAELSLEAITGALGRQIPTGQLSARVQGRSLVLRAGPASVTLPLPSASLFPCEGEVTLTADRLTLTCTVTEIPPGLVEAVT
jgi:hypothetical protein